MEKLKFVIKENWDQFSNLDSHEVCELDAQHIDSDIVEYLKSVERFDYDGICVYYVSEKNEVWIENNNK